MSQDTQQLTTELAEALKNGKNDQAETLTRKLLSQGIKPLDVIQNVLVPTLTSVGERFQNFEIFLPELMMVGETAEKISAIVEQATLDAGDTLKNQGVVVIGQVEGDMHDIGRNIVGTLLKSHGFEVIDLGRNVPAREFLETAERDQADIVALSALMTTTLPAQKRTINLFTEVKQRDRYAIIVGGSAVNQAWAEEIGSDGYSPDAAGAVALCKELMNS